MQRNLLKETQSLTRSWMRYLSEELGQICSLGFPPSSASHPGSRLNWTGWKRLSVGSVEAPVWWILWMKWKVTSLWGSLSWMKREEEGTLQGSCQEVVEGTLGTVEPQRLLAATLVWP